MALKDLIVRRGKSILSPRKLIIKQLKNWGVSAPVAMADAILRDFGGEGYILLSGPRRKRPTPPGAEGRGEDGG